MLKSLSKVSNLPTVSKTAKFSDRLKGTLLGKWADYWKNLFIDYKQMLVDLRTDIQDEPKKAMIWATGLATIYALAKSNPDELEFRDQLKQIDNEIVMVSDSILNEKANEHVKSITTYYNQGVIHYQNLGIASIMYTSDMSESCDVYKAHCKYLQPTYLSWPARVVDIGFMGRWWNLYIKTTDYDVK